MITLTAMAIGFLSIKLRSAFCCALAGCLILVVFGLASLVSGGAVSWTGLFLAVAGYNAGIAAMIGASLVAATYRPA